MTGSVTGLKIAINAISLRKGGTVIALDKLLSRLVETAPQREYHVYLPVTTSNRTA